MKRTRKRSIAVLLVMLNLIFWANEMTSAQDVSTRSSQTIDVQSNPRPFELNLSIGGFVKTMEGSVGLGILAYAEPRYFIKPRLAITGRIQGASYSTFPVAPMADMENLNVNSLLGGVLFRDQALRRALFWGVQTGVAFTSEYQGTDSDGYAVFGNRQSFWVLQPRLGFALGRFETELSYHYSPAREARFGELSIGWRCWGVRKSEYRQ